MSDEEHEAIAAIREVANVWIEGMAHEDPDKQPKIHYLAGDMRSIIGNLNILAAELSDPQARYVVTRAEFGYRLWDRSKRVVTGPFYHRRVRAQEYCDWLNDRKGWFEDNGPHDGTRSDQREPRVRRRRK